MNYGAEEFRSTVTIYPENSETWGDAVDMSERDAGKVAAP